MARRIQVLETVLQSFRNHGAFHEDFTVGIGRRLVDLLKPHWLRIGGYFYPRGGMPIDVSGRPESHLRKSGCLTRASLPIADPPRG